MSDGDRHCYIPGYIMDLDISWAKKAVWGRINALQQEAGYCYASNGYLSDDLGMSERTVQRHIKELKGDGLVRRDYGESGDRRLYAEFPGDTKDHPPTETSPGGDESVTPPPTNPSPPSNNRDVSVDGKEDINAQAHEVIDFWNSFDQLQEARKIEGSLTKRVIRMLEVYDKSEIKQAVKTYAEVYEDERYWYTSPHSPRKFMTDEKIGQFLNGTEQFINEGQQGNHDEDYCGLMDDKPCDCVDPSPIEKNGELQYAVQDGNHILMY